MFHYQFHQLNQSKPRGPQIIDNISKLVNSYIGGIDKCLYSLFNISVKQGKCCTPAKVCIFKILKKFTVKTSNLLTAPPIRIKSLFFDSNGKSWFSQILLPRWILTGDIQNNEVQLIVNVIWIFAFPCDWNVFFEEILLDKERRREERTGSLQK